MNNRLYYIKIFQALHAFYVLGKFYYKIYYTVITKIGIIVQVIVNIVCYFLYYKL